MLMHCYFATRCFFTVATSYYYYVGYETGSNHLMVVDIDLDKMFPDAVNWMKKMLK